MLMCPYNKLEFFYLYISIYVCRHISFSHRDYCKDLSQYTVVSQYCVIFINTAVENIMRTFYIFVYSAFQSILTKSNLTSDEVITQQCKRLTA